MAARSYAFEYWDVFTKTPLKGNPLCVFLDARGMTDPEMQAMARETNLSETTFVFPSSDDPRVRIFSPAEEYPFAGHPTLGTAMALRKPGMKRMVLQEKIGPVPVRFEGDYGEMQQADPVFAERHPKDTISRLLNIPVDDFLPEFPIVNVSTGQPNLIVVLKSLRAIQALRPDWPRIRAFSVSKVSPRMEARWSSSRRRVALSIVLPRASGCSGSAVPSGCIVASSDKWSRNGVLGSVRLRADGRFKPAQICLHENVA